MRIVYLIERIDIGGGIERSLTTRVNYLVEKYNHEITIICTEKKTGIPFFKINKRIKIVFLEKLTAKKTILSRIKLRYNQSKFVLDLNPDIIISTKYTLHNLFIKLINKDAKLISELRETKENYDINRNKSLKGKINAVIRDYIFKKQDLLIVLTNADKKKWGFSNIKVIPNPKTIESKTISSLRYKQVLAIGRLEKVKRFDKLIDVWFIVNKKHPDWKLKIGGKGSEFSRIVNRIKQLNLSDSIEITGKFVDVTTAFLSSSIFVLTSQFESFGNVLVEAKVFGIPVIAFDVPNGPKEIIAHKQDGFIVKDDNIEEMAHQIILLIENPELLREMGRNARNNSKKYDLSTIVDYYNKTITS